MDMETEVFLELVKTLVGSLVTRAGVGGCFVSVGQGANLLHQLARRIVLAHHRIDRILDCLEKRHLYRRSAVRSTFERVSKREQNLFLFLHMHQHFAGNVSEEPFDLRYLAVVASMLFANLCEQHAETRDGITDILVVSLADVFRQLIERSCSPRCFAWRDSLAVQA